MMEGIFFTSRSLAVPELVIAALYDVELFIAQSRLVSITTNADQRLMDRFWRGVIKT